MCGRYSIRKPVTKTADLVKTNIKVEDTDNYNAHPTQKLPVIKSYSNGKALELYEWGLVPSWSKKLDKFSPLLMQEEKPLWKKLLLRILSRHQDVLFQLMGIMNGKEKDKTKTPYYFSKEDDELMYFAGIYQNDQFCIITREATEKISTIHHREPMIINQSQINNYLNIKKDAMEILNSIKPPNLKFHEISKDVNNPVNNDPALIKPLN